MHNRGRFSLTIAIILMVLGVASLTFGVLSAYDNVLSPAFRDVLGQIGIYVSIVPGRWALVEFGLLLILLSSIVFGFRLRKPRSMFLPFALFLIYGTAAILFRVWKGIPHPDMVMKYFDETKRYLLLVLLAIEIAITCVLFFLTSVLDEKWRIKDEHNKRRLESEGLYLGKDALDEEKAVVRQRKDNELEERRRKKNQREYDEEKEKAIRIEERREKRRKSKEERDYDRLKEKEELRKEALEEKERLKREKERNKALDKLDDEARNKKKRQEREERKRKREENRLRKEEKKNRKGDKNASEGKESEEPKFTHRRPDEPIEFPDFIESPHFRQFDGPSVKKEAKAASFQSESVMDRVNEEMKREEAIKESEKTTERPDIHQSKFKSGGMLEATIEMMNSIKDENLGEKPLNRETRTDFQSREIKKENHDGSSSFAPSGLSPDHPRYKLFQNLQNGVRVNEEVKEEEKKSPSFAPSSLSPEHPRYQMFKNIEKKDTRDSEFRVSHFPSKEFEPEVKEKSASKSEETSFIREEMREGSKSLSPFKSDSPEKKEEDKRDEGKMEQLRFQFQENSGPQESSEDNREYIREKREYDTSFENIVGISHLTSSALYGYSAIAERAKREYSYPPIDYLKEYPNANSDIDSDTIERGNIIVDTYAQQKTEVEIENIIKGPTVTMYELHIGEGTLINRITSRENELNYALGGKSVRILAPIRGKKAVGIEVPNDKSAVVGFKELVRDMRRDPKAMSYRIPMILGKTITGESVVIDVAKMPHMIIAGTTGSGKSVSINSFICTLIYHKSPKEVRLILVDPKVVELSVYNGIPHLLTPVITDQKKVVKALNYLVEEMERRYQMLNNYGVRNIDSYNEKVEKEHLQSEKMPYIVLIIDEMADLMAVAKNEVETQITRLAAKARAAGIHLVLATQRPTTEVITGTIKSNLPGRIAFAVANNLNSRVILDEGGAEALLGKGDMLLLDPSNAIAGLRRIQGAFLSEDEVDMITHYAKEHSGPLDQLEEEIFTVEEEKESDDDDVDWSFEDSDEASYEEAIKIVLESKKASASYLQRRMRIGYNKAARLIEMMEERGVVGPSNGGKPREILKM